jgi:hypothetical protein
MGHVSFCSVLVIGINLLGESLNIIKKNKKVLLYASKVVSLKVNAKKDKQIFMSHHQNAGQNNSNTEKNLSKMWQNSNIWE